MITQVVHKELSETKEATESDEENGLEDFGRPSPVVQAITSIPFYLINNYFWSNFKDWKLFAILVLSFIFLIRRRCLKSCMTFSLDLDIVQYKQTNVRILTYEVVNLFQNSDIM